MNAAPSRRAILFVCGADLTGPSEKQALWFARELASRGHRSAVGLCGSSSSELFEGTSATKGVELIWQSFRGRRLARRTLESAERLCPDVIHAWNSRPAVVAATRSYARATGAPVFVRWEDDEWGQAEGIPARTQGMRLRHRLRRVAGLLNPPVWNVSSDWSIRWASKHALAFDGLTPALAQEVRERTGRPCSVLLPAAPLEAWEDKGAARVLPEQLRDKSVLLYTGDINFGREPDVRLGLAATALAQGRGHDVVFVHAGRSTSGAKVESLAVEAGMRPGSAVSLGNLPFAQIPPLLREAEVLLQPGRPTNFNRLGLPSKLQSYLASGTPCITFAVGSGELFVDRREVLKTHGSEPTELADRIVEALTDDELRKTLSVHAPEAARRLFDPVANTDALLEHYEREIAGEPQFEQGGYSLPASSTSSQKAGFGSSALDRNNA